ncbi:hypothetical protein Aperf_G00000008977 [Anoplocephala perfoliata]
MASRYGARPVGSDGSDFQHPMLSHVTFERDYTNDPRDHHQLLWRYPTNTPDDPRALGQLFDGIRQRGKFNNFLLFLTAIDIITYARTEFLVQSLQQGGILALRRHFLKTNPFSKDWDGVAPGIAILNKLVSSSIEVRSCLLDAWPSIMRPLKAAFLKMERIRKKLPRHTKTLVDTESSRNIIVDQVEAFHEQLLPYIIDDPRVLLQREGKNWVTFSDYLRGLELMFAVAQDRTPQSVERICRLNRSIEENHVSIMQINAHELPVEPTPLPGPRISLKNIADRLEIGTLETTYIQTDVDIAIKAAWDIQFLKLDKAELFENLKPNLSEGTCWDMTSPDAEESSITGKVESNTTSETACMDSAVKVQDSMKHNKLMSDESDTIQNARRYEKNLSETWAIAVLPSRRLRRDPRQSERFKRLVKPLVNSLILQRSKDEAASIIFAGYNNLPSPKLHSKL